VGGGQRDAEEGVGAEPALVLGAVELDHAPVEGRLILTSMPTTAVAQLAADVADGLEHPLAAVAGLVPVAQLQGLPGAGGGAGGDRRAADGPVGGDHIGLDGGIAAGIQDLAGTDVDDLGHGASPG
jgi:hypothetical protein